MVTMTGRMCVIWPVSSKTMTEVEMVCVTAPAMAAAPGGQRSGEGGVPVLSHTNRPTTAYPPGDIVFPLMPLGNHVAIDSPISRPKAAPGG